MREDHDQWNITTSVGVTALWVAAARVLISREENSLFTDPYAAILVEAAKYSDMDLLDPQSWPSKFAARFMLTKFLIAVRTKIIDDAITIALGQGEIGQIVIIGSGLDTRAYRLADLGAVTTFELDRKEVIEFKTSALQASGVFPIGNYQAVAADLREDWFTALIAVGFDPHIPTVWITEGLLMYLPSDAQRQLAHIIEQNSAPGSRWIADMWDEQVMEKFDSLLSQEAFNARSLWYDTTLSTRDLVTNWSVVTETMAANSKKYEMTLPQIIYEFLPGSVQEKHGTIDYVLNHTGFYIADK